MSWKCIARIHISPKKTILQGNDLRFETKDDAKDFCAMLCDPPHIIKNWRIKEAPEPANFRIKDGKLYRIKKDGNQNK